MCKPFSEPPKLRAVLQTPTGEVLQELSKNDTKQVILHKEALNILNNSLTSDSSIDALFTIECNASFPVDFVYYGERVSVILVLFQTYPSSGVSLRF